MRSLVLILCFFVFSCASLQRKIYNINKDYNQRKKQENNFNPECPSGAYYETCGSGCGLPTCGNYHKNQRLCPSVCTEGCVCIGSKVLDELLNQCVEVENCSY
tara:strand:+ start:317 stop:625 length:309 start_codon:yes stop_codon:yes gene_type:complete